MPALVSRGFPLFPLGIVALPTERIPLHIFEDRYRRMIERCLAAAPDSLEREFGILWLSDDELKDVGCACEVDAVLDRMDDGRLNILARGRPRLGAQASLDHALVAVLEDVQRDTLPRQRDDAERKQGKAP